MLGRVDAVDSSQIPQHFRGGSQLKTHFLAVRASFTVTTDKWRASGHNDAGRYPSFLSKRRTGELKSLSKRLYILFTCCRMGTPYADEMLIKMSVKVISCREA